LLPDENPTFEVGIAALAGFLAGHALHRDWPLLERLCSLLFGT
jgi:hypothetical protein